MILLTFKSRSGLRLGVKTQAGVVDIRAAFTDLAMANDGLVSKVLTENGPWILEESHLEYGPCLPKPGKIICIGQNYSRHALESGMQIPETPVIFSKFNNAISASGEGIPLPGNAREYDYEAELAVVIGRSARNVAETEALDYIFGYCNANDLSARDLQFRSTQWLLGKSVDKFMPIGPYLVTREEVPDPQNLEVCSWVNGDPRQHSNTADMIFPVKHLVSYLSQYMTLEPGDVILTGTPEGVVLGRPQKDWLVPGDVVTVQVGNLGRLMNRMVKEG
jgi:2-keto-4-pentenoate hydratase/2-oxohepta-3-ene-1,7-dioic acid hydratase in catechol pathway